MGIYNAAPNKKDKYHQGTYQIKNSEKFIGNEEKCFYRSSYELKFMVYCDSSENVVKWGSEQIAIPYQDWDPIAKTYKDRRYFIDFIVEDIKGDKWLIEVKPLSETLEIFNETAPAPPKNETSKSLENYEYKLRQWSTNRHKWSQAIEYAQARGYKFKIITEESLNKSNVTV